MQKQNPTENELEVLLDTMAEGLIVIGPDHRILRWNRSMTRLTGYPPEETVGHLCTMLRGEDSPCLEKCLGLVSGPLSDAARVDGEEALIRRKDGALVPLLVHARAIPDGAGGSQGAVVTFTDMTRVRRLEEENRRLQESAAQQDRFHELVGRSDKMRELFRLVELAAASDETILITGETGTGKELVARAIHRHSARADGPLVAVNCAALSESLLESELFGHVKGAFTGAIRDYQGRFEQARGGVLFLDEVGDLPPLVQVKLLRVIQDRVIERVGEGRPRPVASSAKTSSTGSMSFPSTSRRCASAARISPPCLTTSSSDSPRVPASGLKDSPLTPCASSWTTAGPEMSANSKTPWPTPSSPVPADSPVLSICPSNCARRTCAGPTRAGSPATPMPPPPRHASHRPAREDASPARSSSRPSATPAATKPKPPAISAWTAAPSGVT